MGIEAVYTPALRPRYLVEPHCKIGTVLLPARQTFQVPTVAIRKFEERITDRNVSCSEAVFVENLIGIFLLTDGKKKF